MTVAAAGLLLALVLVVSATAKLVDGPGTRMALRTYGIRRENTARAAWGLVVGIELTLAAGLAAGSRPLAWAAAGVLGAFAFAQAAALARGRAGAPCACFGARGRLSRGSLARSIALAAVALGVALVPRPALTAEQWLGLGLGAALLGLAVLSLVVLALAREIGVLRMAVSPRSALDVPHEGPAMGVRTPLADFFDVAPSDGRLRLAVFGSQGCAMCQALRPVVAGFARNPLVALREFDDVADAGAWSAAQVPGSPYAIALDADGTVLAKGTFNSGAQLESVLGSAERRRAAREPDLGPSPPAAGRATTTAATLTGRAA